MRCTWVLDD